MSRTPRRYDAEQVRRFSDTTIAYYDRFVVIQIKPATALGRAAIREGYSVLFVTAPDAVLVLLLCLTRAQERFS